MSQFVFNYIKKAVYNVYKNTVEVTYTEILHRIWNGILGYFTLRGFSDKPKDAISNVTLRLNTVNFNRTLVIAPVIVLFQICFIISDIYSGSYSFVETRYYLNFAAEILLTVSGIAIFIFGLVNYNRIRESMRDMYTVYITYFSILTVGFILYIISDFLGYTQSSTVYYAAVILMLVPILGRKEYLLFYSSFVMTIIVMIFITGGVSIGTNMQVLLVFVCSMIASAQMRVAKIGAFFSEYETEELNRQLHFSSEHDTLTGIPNRRGLDIYISKHLAKGVPEGTEYVGAMCDVDFFKNFNDTYSHIEGDNVLSEIASALDSYVKSWNGEGFVARMGEGFVARMGGEEFLIIYKNDKDGNYSDFLSGICKTVEALGRKSGDGATFPTVTMSVGATLFKTSPSITLDTFYRDADNCLYYVKRNGRNAACLDGVIIGKNIINKT